MVKIYKCDKCGKFFNELDYRKTNYESEFGIGGLFTTRTTTYVGCCPHCRGEDFNEMEASEIMYELGIEKLLNLIDPSDLLEEIEIEEVIDELNWGKK